MGQPTVIWEVTRSDGRRFDELSTYEAYKTLDQIALLKPGDFIITGDDPLARHDILELVDYARRRGLKPAIHLIPSENLTPQAIDRLRPSGAAALILGLNGASSYSHDAVTGMRGSFTMTINAISWANRAGIAVEIHTLLTSRNITELIPLADLLADLGVKAWCVSFPVRTATSRKRDILTAREAERAFEILASIEEADRMHIRTMEAPEYRRYLIQRGTSDPLWADFANYIPADAGGHAIDDVVFIEANGAVRPSEFLPISAGNVRYQPLYAIVRASDLFVAFRDRTNLTGKCGRCDFKQLCGGSRARAWATTGLLFGPDPLCAYQPPMAEAKEAAS